MKASVIREYGGPNVLRLEDCPDPQPGPGDLLVRIAAASINPVDTIERAGLIKDVRPLEFPAILGWDLAGTVVTVGPKAHGFSVGDRVFAWAYHTYAELCAVDAMVVAKIPEGIGFDQAAALPVVGTTGTQLITQAAGLKGGQAVLISGAVGSVGRSAVYTAKDRGAKVIAGVRKSQVAEATQLGADQVVALDDDGAFNALPQVDVVANTVRGKTAERLLGKVKQGGLFASVTGVPEKAKEYPSIRTIAFVSRQSADALRYVMEGVKLGRLTIPIGHRLPLKNAAQGHALVEKGGAGKVILLP